MKYLYKGLILLTVVFTVPQIAYPCSCFRQSLKDEVNSTPLIFVGKVVGREQDQNYVPPVFNASPSIQRMIATRKKWNLNLEVSENFKGVKEKKITMTDFTQDGPCEGIHFEKGDVALIFADFFLVDKSGDDELTEVRSYGLCSRTQHFDPTSEDYLGLKKFDKIGAEEVLNNFSDLNFDGCYDNDPSLSLKRSFKKLDVLMD